MRPGAAVAGCLGYAECVIVAAVQSTSWPAVIVVDGLRIEETARKVAEKRRGNVKIVWAEEYRSFTIGDDEPFLGFMDGVFRRCGMRPLHPVTGGGSDANVFNQKGITAINISTGMKKVHSTNEQISLKDLKAGCLILLMAVSLFPDFHG